MPNKYYTTKYTLICFFLGCVLFLIYFASGKIHAQEVPTFQEFISQFSNAEQEQAHIIWDSIERGTQSLEIDQALSPDQKISDEELFSEITAKTGSRPMPI